MNDASGAAPIYCDCKRPWPVMDNSGPERCRRCGFRIKPDDTVPPIIALHPELGHAIQEIDAAVCNGDALDAPESRAEMLAHVERWTRLLKEEP